MGGTPDGHRSFPAARYEEARIFVIEHAGLADDLDYRSEFSELASPFPLLEA
jgi:hypothetical protein